MASQVIANKQPVTSGSGVPKQELAKGRGVLQKIPRQTRSYGVADGSGLRDFELVVKVSSVCYRQSQLLVGQIDRDVKQVKACWEVAGWAFKSGFSRIPATSVSDLTIS